MTGEFGFPLHRIDKWMGECRGFTQRMLLSRFLARPVCVSQQRGFKRFRHLDSRKRRRLTGESPLFWFLLLWILLKLPVIAPASSVLLSKEIAVQTANNITLLPIFSLCVCPHNLYCCSIIGGGAHTLCPPSVRTTISSCLELQLQHGPLPLDKGLVIVQNRGKTPVCLPLI